MPKRFIRYSHHGRPDGWQHDVSHCVGFGSDLPISGLQASPKVIRAQARDLDMINAMSIGSEPEPVPPLTFRRLGNMGMTAAETVIPPAASEAA